MQQQNQRQLQRQRLHLLRRLLHHRYVLLPRSLSRLSIAIVSKLSFRTTFLLLLTEKAY
jgi:hypothetical protein